MYSRTTDDYQNMVLSGIRAVIEPSFWLGQERTSSKTLEDYWEYLISFERKRAAEFGIDHYCAISINPKEANNKIFSDEFAGAFVCNAGVILVFLRGKTGTVSVAENVKACKKTDEE